jgi:hypothetical protein
MGLRGTLRAVLSHGSLDGSAERLRAEMTLLTGTGLPLRRSPPLIAAWGEAAMRAAQPTLDGLSRPRYSRLPAVVAGCCDTCDPLKLQESHI